MKVYLDNSSTTKVRDEVVKDMVNIFLEDYGNPSSLHRMGLSTEKKIQYAREQLAKMINSKSSDIIFTSGGTESNNIALHSAIEKIDKLHNNIATTTIEHASVYNVFKEYESKGYDVRYLEVDEYGRIKNESIEKVVDENTSFVSIIYVNNEIGTVQEIGNIIKKFRDKNKDIKIHIDGVQALGKIKIDVNKINVDTISFSSHKIYGPKGVGGLYIKNKNIFLPQMFGGGQELGMRPGTENVPGIIGFGRACELIYKNLNNDIEKLNAIKKEYINKIYKEIDDIRINTPEVNSAPHILSISFKDVKAEVLLHYLENSEIYVSTGAACSSKIKENRIIRAIGLDEKFKEGTIRISLGHYNSIEEVEYVVSKIANAVKEIRMITR